MTVHTILKHVSHVCRDEAEAERDEVFQVLPSAVRVRGGKLEQGHVHEETSHHAAQYVEHQGVFVLVLPRADAGFGFSTQAVALERVGWSPPPVLRWVHVLWAPYAEGGRGCTLKTTSEMPAPMGKATANRTIAVATKRVVAPRELK